MSSYADGGKPEKNPSVGVWLKYHDPEFYEAIEDQGIIQQLRPRRESALTFMYPAEKSYRDKIIEKLNGNDATVGVNMVQALIIVRENLADPADWLERKDNIPNALNQKVELSPDSTNKQVILANGATLTLNKSFASRDNNISVWDYKGKEMPLDGKPAEFVKRPPRSSKKGKSRKTGGSGMPAYPSKCVLAKRLEDQALCLLKAEGVEKFQMNNPYTAAMVSFYQYLEAQESKSLKQLQELCEPNSVAAFYATVLPYTASSLLEEEVSNWLRDTRAICLESNPNGAWVDINKKIGPLVSDDFHELLLEKKEDMQGAAIKGLGEGLYKSHCKCSGDDKKFLLRLKGDEIRFIVNCAMAGGKYNDEKISELFVDIQYMHSPESSKSFFLVNNSSTDPVFLATVACFIASRCFISLPKPKSGLTEMSFSDALNGSAQIDPTEHFITDDSYYLEQTTSAPEADFMGGFKKVISNMPGPLKTKFIGLITNA
jgi:hypothetical protein